MVDAPNGTDPSASSDIQTRLRGFLNSTTGKFVLGGIALVVVLVVVGFFAYTYFFSAPSKPTAIVTPARSGSTTSSVSIVPTAALAPVEPPERPLSSSFTFRNIFAPTQAPAQPAIAPTSSVTAASTGSSAQGSTSTSSTPKVAKDTLFLESIQTQNGKRTATFIWNSFHGALSEGESIPNSPWQVLQIGTSSVVMLFGDTQVSLSTGQGLTK